MKFRKGIIIFILFIILLVNSPSVLAESDVDNMNEKPTFDENIGLDCEEMDDPPQDQLNIDNFTEKNIDKEVKDPKFEVQSMNYSTCRPNKYNIIWKFQLWSI